MTELIFPNSMLGDLRHSLLAHSPNEAAALLEVAPAFLRTRSRLLARDYRLVPAGDGQTPTSVLVPPSIIVPCLKKARREGLGVFFVHTHPFSLDQLSFSRIDDDAESLLAPAVFARASEGPHGSIVLGQLGFAARLWRRSNSSEPIDRLWEVGAHLRPHFHGSEASCVEVPPDVDRNVRAFGRPGQELLRKMTIGIVGLGGTGSIVTEQLAHLGVGGLVLVDPDQLEQTNLNRVVGATPHDVGRSKVDVAAAHVRRIRPSVHVMPIEGDVRMARDLDRMREADFIFCCTDSHGSRAMLNQLAYQYFIPTIDMGVRIQTDGQRVEAIAGRVQLLAPGFPCLVCGSVLDPEEVRRDLLTQEARERDPYIVGVQEPQPAVISLNGIVSSLAVTMFLATVTGLPSRARHQVLVGTRGVIRDVASSPQPGCPICAKEGAFGRGGSWLLPGRLE